MNPSIQAVSAWMLGSCVSPMPVPLWTNTTDPNVPHTLHGNSECAFSGQNDTFTGNPDVPDDDGFTRTQNWGQVGKEGRAFLTSIGLNPGIACNPSKS